MKLGEALSKLKNEKSALARMMHLRKENILLPEGEEPSFNPKELSIKINKKIEDIRNLKIQIQKTNLSTKISGKDITIAEAIIKINDIRSKLASLSGLFTR